MQLKVRRAMVVHGLDGLDEISTTAPTQVSEVKEGEIRSYVLDPSDYGITAATLSDISGGSPVDNALIITDILQGKQGARRELVLLNAAAALVVAEKAGGIKEGLVFAAQSIDSGAALDKLDHLRRLSLH